MIDNSNIDVYFRNLEHDQDMIRSPEKKIAKNLQTPSPGNTYKYLYQG